MLKYLALAFLLQACAGAKSEEGPIIGIDLGTTYSCVGFMRYGKVTNCAVQTLNTDTLHVSIFKSSKHSFHSSIARIFRIMTDNAFVVQVEIIANEQGSRITPSWVAFTEEGEQLVVCYACSKSRATASQMTLCGFCQP
jgi:heat shock protein 5